jgi:glycerophosphoryl diester phosphodiesterase
MRTICLLIALGSPYATRAADVFDFSRAPDGAPPPPWHIHAGAWTVRAGELVGAAGAREEGHILLRDVPRTDFRIRMDFAFAAVTDPTRWAAICFGAVGPGAPPYHVFTIRFQAHEGSGLEYASRDAGGAWLVRCQNVFDRELARHEPLAAEVCFSGGRFVAYLNGRKVLSSPFAMDCGPGLVGIHLSGCEVAVRRFAVSPLTDEERGAMAVPRDRRDRVVRVAHRGFSAVAPENTLAAFREALAAGVDGVEFDVRRTKDGELVLLHDETVKRTTDFEAAFGADRSHRIEDLTLAELGRLDAGAWKGGRWRGERIPTLAAALALLRGRATPVVEIKPAGIGKEVADGVKRLGMEDEVFVQSFEPQALRDIRSVCPTVATGYLTGTATSVDAVGRAREHARVAREAGANVVVVNWQLLEPEYIRDLRRRGLALWTWTVDDPGIMRMLLELGVDGVITNRPDILNGVLDGRPGGAR